MIDFLPFIAIAWFIYFISNNRMNNPMVGLIFLSYLFFATNYTNFGLDLSFDIFRSLHRVIGIVCILMFFIYALKNRVNILHEWVPRILILYMLVLLFSYIGNDIYLEHYTHNVRNFIFISLIVIFLYYKLDSQDKLGELFKLIVMATLLLSFFVVLQIIIKGWGDRETLFFSNPHYLAIALFPGFTILLFSKYKSWWILSSIVVFSIFSTGSRGVELSVIFVLALFIFKNIKKFNKIYLSVFILAAISATTLFFDKIVLKKNISGTRIVLTKIALNSFSENPINGIGYGQFKKSFFKYIDEEILQLNNDEINKVYLAANIETTAVSVTSAKVKEDIMNSGRNEKMTHNDLLTIIAELGSAGLAFTVFLFYKLYIELNKLLLHSRNNFFLSLGLISGSLIFSLFHNNITSFVFWFILFVPFIMNRNYESTP